MATRKRHSKPQFVIPEDVESRETSGWTFRTEEAREEPPCAEVKPEEPAAAEKPAAKTNDSLLPTGAMENGMKAFSYGFMAMGQMMLFSIRVATMPWTLATQILRR